jgi:hypothetical protein
MTRFYVRASPSALRRALGSRAVLVASPSSRAWTGVEADGVPTPHADPLDRVSGLHRPALAALSERLATDVVWLAVDPRAAALHYVRWDRGVQRRELAHGCLEAGEWDRVAGHPDPWEAGCAGTNVLPVHPDVDDLAAAIARHHRLPGWEADWVETREFERRRVSATADEDTALVVSGRRSRSRSGSTRRTVGSA